MRPGTSDPTRIDAAERPMMSHRTEPMHRMSLRTVPVPRSQTPYPLMARAYSAVQPPSTEIVVPVTCAAASEHR